MRSFSTLDLIRAQPWTNALFTTFSLSLAYFEAVILDALWSGPRFFGLAKTHPVLDGASAADQSASDAG